MTDRRKSGRSFAEVAHATVKLERFWNRLGAVAPRFQRAVQGITIFSQARLHTPVRIDDEAVTFGPGRIVFDMPVPTVRMLALAVAATRYHLTDRGAKELGFLGCMLIEAVEGRVAMRTVDAIAFAIARRCMPCPGVFRSDSGHTHVVGR